MSTCHKSKRWPHKVLVRQTGLCSVNVAVDSTVTFENLRYYVILLILLLL